METKSSDANDFSRDEIYDAINTSDLETLNVALKVLNKEQNSLVEAKLVLLQVFFQVEGNPKNADQRTLNAMRLPAKRVRLAKEARERELRKQQDTEVAERLKKLKDNIPEDQKRINENLLSIQEILERHKIAVPSEIVTSISKISDFLTQNLHPQLACNLVTVLCELQHLVTDILLKLSLGKTIAASKTTDLWPDVPDLSDSQLEEVKEENPLFSSYLGIF